MVVREKDSYNFAYVLPQQAGEPTRIVVPSSVQMGWVESPPLFCAVTESARDITQLLVDNKVCLPTHPLKDKISIQNVPMRAWTATPTKLLQVYVDDFCNAATQSLDGSHVPLIRWASIHGMHSVFPEPDVTGHQNGKDPLSKKKLDRGDGNFVSTLPAGWASSWWWAWPSYAKLLDPGQTCGCSPPRCPARRPLGCPSPRLGAGRPVRTGLPCPP